MRPTARNACGVTALERGLRVMEGMSRIEGREALIKGEGSPKTKMGRRVEGVARLGRRSGRY